MFEIDKKVARQTPSLTPRPGFVQNGRIPLVYCPNYDFACLGTLSCEHSLQPFKRREIFSLLSQKLEFTHKEIFEADPIHQRDLDLAHTRQYIRMISQNPAYAARVMYLSEIASFTVSDLQEKLLRPAWYAAGGTLLATELAQQYQWAINLSGGFHHAKNSSGSGYCFIADTAIAAIKHILHDAANRVLIVDLDAHRGNGVRHFSDAYPQIDTFDMYNSQIFPGPADSTPPGHFDYPLNAQISDAQYLDLLYQELPRAILEQVPNLLIFNAGTDIWKGDLVGGMSLSEATIYKRDQFVFRQAFIHGIPIAMVLSGGYSPETHRVVAESIHQLRYQLLS